METSTFNPPVTRIGPPSKWAAVDFTELWRYRELLFLLIKRDIVARYRQSALGFTWAFIPPIAQMMVFTLIFGKIAKLGPDGVPYFLFSFAALLPWNYFTNALTNTSGSLLSGKTLITKVYFPRLILPLASAAGALVDFLIGFVVLAVLMIFAGHALTMKILLLPLFLVIAFATALAVGLWLTAMSVKYRDVSFISRFVIQLWLFLTPVVFAVEKIPEKYQFWLWLNPMTGVVEGFRWSLLGTSSVNWPYMLCSLTIVLAILVSGFLYFKASEQDFADLI